MLTSQHSKNIILHPMFDEVSNQSILMNGWRHTNKTKTTTDRQTKKRKMIKSTLK